MRGSRLWRRRRGELSRRDLRWKGGGTFDMVQIEVFRGLRHCMGIYRAGYGNGDGDGILYPDAGEFLLYAFLIGCRFNA